MSIGEKPIPDNNKDILDALLSKVDDKCYYCIEGISNELGWVSSMNEDIKFRKLLKSVKGLDVVENPGDGFKFKLQQDVYNAIQQFGSYSKYLDSLPKTDNQLKFIILSKLNEKKNGEGFSLNELASHLDIDINSIKTLCQQMTAVKECDSNGSFAIILPAGIHAIRKGFYETNANPLFQLTIEKMIDNSNNSGIIGDNNKQKIKDSFNTNPEKSKKSWKELLLEILKKPLTIILLALAMGAAGYIKYRTDSMQGKIPSKIEKHKEDSLKKTK